MKGSLIISILLHSIFLAIWSIVSNHNQGQQNKSQELIMVSILENLDNKGTREEVKRVNLHRTQELHKTEAIKETSVPIATEAIKKPSIPIANEMTSLQFLTETSTNTTQIQTGAVETLTTETLENCVVQDMPSGVQNFQPLSCSQDYNSEGNTGKDVIGSTFGSTNGPSFLKKVNLNTHALPEGSTEKERWY